jgi:NTE family protein
MAKIYTLIFLVLFSVSISAQNSSSTKTGKRPKIGLVLSGGGAKGFAHIGAIKLLEECGIKPDYITGTSMGSIVGGLYSMGYTVEEMWKVSDTTNWTFALSNTVPLSEVTMVEKPYYGTFLLNMDLSKKGVALPGGLIEGQNLHELLSVLSRPVHGIESFLDFPIPFTCVATDIVKGEPVALNQGNITEAIRASMAIPSAFTPVAYDTLLLIDGGWTRNLPVQEAIDMGADIIISVNVGAPLKTKDELGSMVSILDQTAWMLSVKDTEKQLELSDYVITPPVSGFSSFAFDKADTIIKLGYEEASKQRDVFLALAKRIYPTGKNEVIIKKPFDKSHYTITSIAVTGNNKTSKKFVAGRLAINSKQTYTAKEIGKKIGLLYGTLYYEKINFELAPISDSTQELQVHVVESHPSKLKLSLYYDTENSIGLNLNVTLRNLAFRNSRLIIDGFLSESPIFGVKYIKYMGNNQNGFLFGDFKYTKDSRFQWENLYGSPAGYNYREIAANIGAAYTVKNVLLVGGSLGFRGAKINPTTNPDTIISKIGEEGWPVKIFAEINTFDRPVFPTRGTKLLFVTEYNFNITQKAKLQPQFNDDIQDAVNDAIFVNPFFSYRFGLQQYVPLAKKFSLYLDIELKFNSIEDVGFNDLSKVGGVAPILYSSVPFWGADRDELIIRQFVGLSAGFQWNFYSSLYLRGKVDYLNTEYPMKWIVPGQPKEVMELYGNTYTSIFGFGVELAYASAIGPVRLVLHQNQYSNDLNVFVAVGFNIYKSFGDF